MKGRKEVQQREKCFINVTGGHQEAEEKHERFWEITEESQLTIQR